ncbi:MAG: alanine racemase [Propionibacteriaceae bacterium]
MDAGGVDALSAIDPATASVVIDLDAFRANLAALDAHIGDSALMVVVKADGYGHGMLACARAARSYGAPWLGVATPTEALTLRAAGDRGSLLAWLYGVDEDLAPAVAADVDLSVSTTEQLSRTVAAAGVTEKSARIHLKIDTGLSRNGARPELWPELCAAAAEAEQTGAVQVVGVWTHFAAADEPDHPSVAVQTVGFDAAVEVARRAGLRPTLLHLANSAAALILPAARRDLVRVGIAAYGIDPGPGIAASVGVTLAPVMTLRAQLVLTKTVRAGDGVSYGHSWHASEPTTLGLVPLGYADGVPRHAGNVAEVKFGTGRAPVRGRICMDQFVVELGPAAAARAGDEVVLFGPGTAGEPTAADWAEACGTIGYEIVTRVGSRVPRVYRGAVDELEEGSDGRPR